MRSCTISLKPPALPMPCTGGGGIAAAGGGTATRLLEGATEVSCSAFGQAMIDRMPTGNPMILGHEACGVVEWVGAEVSRVRPGQRVIVALTPAPDPLLVRYMNRLSDFLFVASRAENNNGAGDVLWVPGANR